MKLRAFCDILEKIATTRFAAKWDNVGLLVEPADCVGSKYLWIGVNRRWPRLPFEVGTRK